MLVRLRVSLLLLLLTVSLSVVAGGATLVRSLEHVFSAGGYTKVTRLARLTTQDLRFANRVENVNGLLELAEKERRIDPIQMMQLSRTYGAATNGDALLLACLNAPKCAPDRFLAIAQTSRLHAEVVKRNPNLGLVQAHHAVGALNENLMIRYFEHSGWTRIEGQVGRTGFDGLFVKYDGTTIKDVLIAESKYNTSSLQETNHGIQMSETWIRRKVVELKERFPDADVYRTLDAYIEAGAYRAVLWNLKIEDDAMQIALSTVKGKGGGVSVVETEASDLAILGEPVTTSIKLKAPNSKFEALVLSWYSAELDAVFKGIKK
jgi:hypothetical protein